MPSRCGCSPHEQIFASAPPSSRGFAAESRARASGEAQESADRSITGTLGAARRVPLMPLSALSEINVDEQLLEQVGVIFDTCSGVVALDLDRSIAHGLGIPSRARQRCTYHHRLTLG